MKETTVWQFTNQKRLTKSEFINYFERKVFRTIRKFEMLPKNKIFKLKMPQNSNKGGTPSGADLNTTILKHILEKKFKVDFSSSPNISSDNLSQAAESIFKNLLNGKMSGPKPDDKPLYYLSDKEVELYAKLKNIKGKKRIEDKKIQLLFNKFKKKNQDLELNVVKALGQIQN